MKKIIYIISGLALFLVLASATEGSPFFELSKQIEIFSELFKNINNLYVDEPEPSTLMKTFIDGLLAQTDPYTNYYTESQIENSRINESEKITGIGVQYAFFDSVATVTEIIQGLAADKAGMQVGDKILAINDKSVVGKSDEDISKALKGEAGSELSIKIGNASGEKNITLKRVEFHETNVPFFGMLNKETGYINLKIFNPNAAKDVHFAFDSLRKKNPEMQNLILDLRENPGGLLQEAVKIVNLFIPKNKLVTTMRGRIESANATYKTLDEPIDVNIPIVVLTNSHSASASEIVSGALQDYDRAVIMGQKTYGKGLVQQVKNLPYGTALKVTIAKYYIPSGRCIQAINYAERNADGSVSRVPDSLKVAFKTASGRKVFDGGGIDPDKILATGVENSFISALQKQHLIFDFATQYKKEHASIASSAEFSLTDADYDKFTAFAQNKKFSYKSKTDSLLEQLKTASTEEDYFTAIEKNYDTTLTKIASTKDINFTNYKPEISALIESEICNRYYYTSGKIEKSIQTDPFVKSAISLLNTPKEYSDLLTAKAK
ncbi:MAG TPA: S41 family peptidase [Chitinophagales bacterium]